MVLRHPTKGILMSMAAWKTFATLAISVLLATSYAVAAATAQDISKQPPATTSYNELMRQLDRLIALTQADLDRQRVLLANSKALANTRRSALNDYSIQLATFSYLNLEPDTALWDLDAARTDILLVTAELERLLQQEEDRSTGIEAELKRVREQVAYRKARLEEMKQTGDRSPEVQQLISKRQELIAVLGAKQRLLEQLLPLHEDWIDRFKRIQLSFADLFQAVDRKIKEKFKGEIFHRYYETFSLFDRATILSELAILRNLSIMIVTTDLWEKEVLGLWKASGYALIVWALLLGLTVFLSLRLKSYLGDLQERPFVKAHGTHRLALTLAQHSVVLSGLTLFFYMSTRIDTFYYSWFSLVIITRLLWIWLLTRWGLILLSNLEPSSLPDRSRSYLIVLLNAIRYAGTIHLIASFIQGDVGILMSWYRLFIDFGLFVWVVLFWKTVPQATFSNRHHLMKPALTAITYGIPIVGFLMELAGYTKLTIHWHFAWAHTGAVVLWWSLFAGMLMEWDRVYHEKTASGGEEPASYTILWLRIRIGQLTWLLSLGIVLIGAWGGQRAILLKIYQALTHPITLGKMSFSVMGVFYAILVLLATHVAARFWRQFFRSQFLSRSGMEEGLQRSIATISVYVLWAFGILIALHVFGLNTASLAVAFGAIGIGIGFGLQNIVNNLVSGIILLFERPIQVGDDVEINGIWATVKKINVRATVVQTYDNASLIIPNSEFISSQVTNWSFKDKRVRRNIHVGVAYGSDVELVRKTILEVVDAIPDVLYHPKPEVLFLDFGDSALIFRLRVWVFIDRFMATESQIRFEIDKKFRERDIVIAFPQRDIHIRSTVGEKRQELIVEEINDAEEGIDQPKKG
ncbi:Potassium efflux system KefA protein / Small-conductance mechanosensitive channel [Olavius algarvensis associated proteobacterium Delta 3]|nr:Potassium efflux system KefA protein / Small-conductance mechanosensitive channel [Olavius algarvensis associated proteobacterium Delta 3]